MEITIKQLTCLRCGHRWFPDIRRLGVVVDAFVAAESGNFCITFDDLRAWADQSPDWRGTVRRPTLCAKCNSPYWDKPREVRT